MNNGNVGMLELTPMLVLSETVAMSAEAFEGTITDLYMPKKKVAQ